MNRDRIQILTDVWGNQMEGKMVDLRKSLSKVEDHKLGSKRGAGFG